MTLVMALTGFLMIALLVSIVFSAFAAVRSSELRLRERYLPAEPPALTSESPHVSPCAGS